MGYPCKCRECGRLFYAPDLSEYVYKINGKVFCSWHCYRKHEKMLDEKKRERIENAKRKPLYKKRMD